MDFMNVGPWELIVVLIIAILVAGPKRMVEIARTLGQMSRQLRDLSREFTTALQAEMKAAEKEAGKTGADLGQVRSELEKALSGSSTVGSAGRKQEPAAPPTPSEPPGGQPDQPRPEEDAPTHSETEEDEPAAAPEEQKDVSDQSETAESPAEVE